MASQLQSALGLEQSQFQGLATVWLLSTLGSQPIRNTEAAPAKAARDAGSSAAGAARAHALKKRDILNVSLPETCRTIACHHGELPLRHVSNLLYGVTLCYNKKTEYVLNDLTSLLLHLQRNLFHSSRPNLQSARTRAGNKRRPRNTPSILNVFNKDGTYNRDFFLNDDPMFDINKIYDINALSFLKDTSQPDAADALHIKQQDYFSELVNFHDLDASNGATAKDGTTLSRIDRENPAQQAMNMAQYNRSYTMDEIPHDVDFNLDIDGEESNSRENLILNINGDSEPLDLHAALAQADANDNDTSAPDLSAYDLGIGKLNERQNINDLDQDEDISGKPPLKKLKTGDIHVTRIIQADDKIGLPTDFLRANYGNYLQTMEQLQIQAAQKKKSSSTTANPLHSKKAFLEISRFETYPDILKDFYSAVSGMRGSSTLNHIFSKPTENNTDDDEDSSRYGSIERGRRLSESLRSSSRSNSVMSAGKGRRLSNADWRNDLFHDNESALLDLEQINDDLENISQLSSDNQNLMQIDLNLPPSSFGRATSRSNTLSSENDMVDILQSNNHLQLRTPNLRRGRGNRSVNSFGNSTIQEDEEIDEYQIREGTVSLLSLDLQSRRFYEYITERSILVGKTTHSNPPYKKKILFEDIVPSKLSSLENDDGIPTNSLDRRVAAGAFLSLLNLASKDALKISTYSAVNYHSDTASPENKFSCLSGFDIIICV